MERLICLVIGYFFGVFQTGFIYGKIKHIDIRNYGSGNAGTTNALRTLGFKAGLITFLGDVLKVILASVVVRLIYTQSHPDSITLLVLYSGIGTVLGHNFPFYLKFKGGKGIAATAGVVLSLGSWQMIVIGLFMFMLSLVITHYVSVGSLVMVLTVYSVFAVCGFYGLIPRLSDAYFAEALIVFFVFVVLAFVRHKANIVRLFTGTERELSVKKKEKTE